MPLNSSRSAPTENFALIQEESGIHVGISPDLTEAARQAASLMLEQHQQWQDRDRFNAWGHYKRRYFTIAMGGGNTVKATYQAWLSDHHSTIDWIDHVRFFFLEESSGEKHWESAENSLVINFIAPLAEKLVQTHGLAKVASSLNLAEAQDVNDVIDAMVMRMINGINLVEAKRALHFDETVFDYSERGEMTQHKTETREGEEQGKLQPAHQDALSSASGHTSGLDRFLDSRLARPVISGMNVALHNPVEYQRRHLKALDIILAYDIPLLSIVHRDDFLVSAVRHQEEHDYLVAGRLKKEGVSREQDLQVSTRYVIIEQEQEHLPVDPLNPHLLVMSTSNEGNSMARQITAAMTRFVNENVSRAMEKKHVKSLASVRRWVKQNTTTARKRKVA